MTAFDDLVEILDAGGPHAAFSSEEVAHDILTRHAHELAQQQRAWLKAHGYDTTCVCDTCSACLAREYISLIDPDADA